MDSYKFQEKLFIDPHYMTVQRASDTAFIPLNQDNRDCRLFLFEWKNGAVVTNPDDSPAPFSNEAVIALGLDPTAIPDNMMSLREGDQQE